MTTIEVLRELRRKIGIEIHGVSVIHDSVDTPKWRAHRTAHEQDAFFVDDEIRRLLEEEAKT